MACSGCVRWAVGNRAHIGAGVHAVQVFPGSMDKNDAEQLCAFGLRQTEMSPIIINNKDGKLCADPEFVSYDNQQGQVNRLGLPVRNSAMNQYTHTNLPYILRPVPFLSIVILTWEKLSPPAGLNELLSKHAGNVAYVCFQSMIRCQRQFGKSPVQSISPRQSPM